MPVAAAPHIVSPPLTPHSPALGERLLVALSEEEFHAFFGETSIVDSWNSTLPCKCASWTNRTDWEHTLREFRPTVLLSCWSTPRLPESFANAADSPLRYVCHVTGSIRGLVPRGFLERGGLVTNWGAMAAPQVAEHALLLALATLRNQPQWRPFVQQNRLQTTWHPIPDLQTKSLFGKRVGLHGFGQIARSLVRLLKAFDVEIYAYSNGVPPGLMESCGVTPCESLGQLFARSEVLFECEALTPQSTNSVNESILAALTTGAVFVNVGRGRVVEEKALWHEAQSGRIRIALDVMVEEPVSGHSILWSLPNAIISPHIGGPTFDRFPQCGRQALNNMIRYFRKEPLESIVSTEIYDRST
jgi:phosphoglycerate dehydrogenase-like enzyme